MVLSRTIIGLLLIMELRRIKSEPDAPYLRVKIEIFKVVSIIASSLFLKIMLLLTVETLFSLYVKERMILSGHLRTWKPQIGTNLLINTKQLNAISLGTACRISTHPT